MRCNESRRNSLRWWKDSLFDQSTPYLDAIGTIDHENVDGHCTDVGFADENWTIPRKVIRPLILARVIQANVFFFQVSGAKWSLMRIAVFAAKGEIGGTRRAMKLLRDNVIKLKRQPSNVRGELTVLASPLGTLDDEPLESPADCHGERPARLSESLAFDCNSSRSEATRSYSSSSPRSCSLIVPSRAFAAS